MLSGLNKMRKPKISHRSQERINHILKKGLYALDSFYKRHGEWDGEKKRRRRKRIKRELNGHIDPGTRSRKHGKQI
jgi:hypothetical protein